MGKGLAFQNETTNGYSGRIIGMIKDCCGFLGVTGRRGSVKSKVDAAWISFAGLSAFGVPRHQLGGGGQAIVTIEVTAVVPHDGTISADLVITRPGVPRLLMNPQ